MATFSDLASKLSAFVATQRAENAAIRKSLQEIASKIGVSLREERVNSMTTTTDLEFQLSAFIAVQQTENEALRKSLRETASIHPVITSGSMKSTSEPESMSSQREEHVNPIKQHLLPREKLDFKLDLVACPFSDEQLQKASSRRVPLQFPPVAVDYKQIHKASSGWGTNENLIITILGCRNAAQRNRLRKEESHLRDGIGKNVVGKLLGKTRMKLEKDFIYEDEIEEKLFDKVRLNKDKDGYWKWFAGNLASGGLASGFSLMFVYSRDYARTSLANVAKAAKKGGERQFNDLIDVYRKTIQSDGVAGIYQGFNISCVGMYNSHKLDISTAAPNMDFCVVDEEAEAMEAARRRLDIQRSEVKDIINQLDFPEFTSDLIQKEELLNAATIKFQISQISAPKKLSTAIIKFQTTATKRCKFHMLETDEFISSNSEGSVLDSEAVSKSYMKMKNLCITLRKEISIDINIHNQHISSSSIDLSAITSGVYNSELRKRLVTYLASWPPSSPMPHVNDLLIAVIDFERSLELWNISSVQGGINARELYHGYIMVWMQDMQLEILEVCKAEKVACSGVVTKYSTSPFAKEIFEVLTRMVMEYEVVISSWPEYTLILEKVVANVERAIIKALERQYHEILAPLRDSIPKRLGMQVHKLAGRQSNAYYSVKNHDAALMKDFPDLTLEVKRRFEVLGNVIIPKEEDDTMRIILDVVYTRRKERDKKPEEKQHEEEAANDSY